jgi:hypothetical protein
MAQRRVSVSIRMRVGKFFRIRVCGLVRVWTLETRVRSEFLELCKVDIRILQRAFEWRIGQCMMRTRSIRLSYNVQTFSAQTDLFESEFFGHFAKMRTEFIDAPCLGIDRAGGQVAILQVLSLAMEIRFTPQRGLGCSASKRFGTKSVLQS